MAKAAARARLAAMALRARSMQGSMRAALNPAHSPRDTPPRFLRQACLHKGAAPVAR